MKKLYIKNFGPVRDAQIDIKRFNLFIGEQSIGKSTIAKLITIFTDYIHLILFCSDSHKEESWKECLNTYDLTSYINDDFYILYENSSSDFSVKLEFTPSSIKHEVISKNKVLTDSSDITKLFLSQKTIYHNELLKEFKNKKLDDNEMAKILAIGLRNSIYIPAERIIASIAYKLLPAMMMIKEQVPNNLLQFINLLFNAKSKYSELHLDLLNATYKIENDNEYIYLDNDNKIPLRNASSGMQSLIPLILILTYGKENTQFESYVVEEPECNLFPDKQQQLIELLLRTIFSSNRSITITTHSPYILSALNNYLYAGKVSNALDDEAKNELKELVEPDLWLNADDCAVYSLGESINNGSYCKNIIDSETGLIDFNYLDGVSMILGEYFSKMQKIYVKALRSQKKNNFQ